MFSTLGNGTKQGLNQRMALMTHCFTACFFADNRHSSRVLRKRTINSGSKDQKHDLADKQHHVWSIHCRRRGPTLHPPSERSHKDAAAPGSHRGGGWRAVEPLHGRYANKVDQFKREQGPTGLRVGDKQNQHRGERTDINGGQKHGRAVLAHAEGDQRYDRFGSQEHG